MITHDSWQRIKEIFQSAQELTPAERSDFLDKACGDDALIRDEVEALLTADAGNEDFLSAPAYEFAASIIAGKGSEFSPDQKIGRYTILYQLGSGGMGQIYLAQDTQLGRKIALKLISPEFATDTRRMLRFEQEARASSALNHPNICVVHETGMTDSGRHFIAMEYVQGSTVRDRLSRGKFTVLEAVNVALQVAAALSSAHASGIVHRDIKPENLMLRPDGYVKVLDFGLAKLMEPQDRSRGSTNISTEAGILMGTVKYMSPEQLRESEVDDRADIWSLGVVLYEMLTNSTPFEARAPNETVAQILSLPPASLKFPDEVPARLQEILAKALEKDRANRYQSVTKLAADLQKVQRELRRTAETESELFSYRPPLTSEERTRPLPVDGPLLTRFASQALYTADFLIGEIRSHKAVAIFSVTSVLALLFLLPGFLRPTPPAALTFSMKPLTNAGTTINSAISPDGKFFAHAEEQGGKQQLVLTQIENSAPSPLVSPANVRYLGLTFSRDNNYLYFTRREEETTVLYRSPVPSRDAEVKVTSDVDSPISFSPSGDQFAFVRLDTQKSEYSLMVAKVDGTDKRVLATRKNGNTFSEYGPAWSPDGSMIVCPVGFWDKGFHMKLMGVDVKTGSEHSLGERLWFSILQVAWQDDMSGLILSARERPTSLHQLWRINYPDTTVQRITNDLTEYQGVSLSGKNIVTVQTNRNWQMWVADVDNSTTPRSITSGVGFSYGVGWTSKGKIVFSSMAQDRLNLMHVNPDGSEQRQLTINAGDNYSPAASPDGRFIVFVSNRNNESFNIWRVNSDDGSEPKQLTFSDGTFYPSISPDSQWVTYDQFTGLTLSIWKVPLEGGGSIKVADRYRMPVFSPDNQFIAGRFDRESGTRDVAIFPANGGEPVRTFSVPVQDWQRVNWLNGHTLSYIDNIDGVSNIWSYDLETGQKKQLTHFNSKRIYAYAWSPDFKQVACQRGDKISDVTMLTLNAQP